MHSILSLNTWKCEAEYFNRIKVLNEQLKELQPDIITFQEAFETLDGCISTTCDVASQLQLYSVSSKSRLKKRICAGANVSSYSNVSILSSYPFEYSRIIPLSSNQQDGGRDAVLGIVVIKNKRIAIVSLHLSHLPDLHLKIKQLNQVINELNNIENCDIKFVCGDFNLTIDNPELQSTLKKEKYNDASKFSEHYGDEITLEIKKKEGVKIDHIIYNVKNEINIQINKSAIVLDKPDLRHGLKVSDHNGVITYFNFN
jgi:endonuclease/exonuclease/phosphatase family metal-dependent hydrolase